MADAPTHTPIGVLVVDDRPEDLLVVDTVLASPRYELVKARSGAEALRFLLGRDFAVIVLDVFMPMMNGFELAALVRSRDRSAHTPIIFLTGADADVAAIYRAYSVGAIDYLSKPVDPEVLRAKVAVFADRFELEQRNREQAAALLASERRNRELEVERMRLASQRRYHSLADAVPHIVWTADPTGQLLYCNQRWMQYLGTAEFKGWLETLHTDDCAALEARWAEALAAGTELAAECRVRGVDGRYRWHLVRIQPEIGGDGDVLAWLGTMTDCEDLHRARAEAEARRRRSELLAEASAALSTSFDPTAGLQQLGSLVVPAIADAWLVELDSEGDDGAAAIVVHADPAQRDALAELAAHHTVERATVGAGEPLLVPARRDVLERLASDAAERRLYEQLGVTAAIVVPVNDHDRRFGTMTFLTTTRSRRRLDADDLAMAAELGRRAGVAIDNARLYRRAERAIRLRDDFLSTASHELRTPLSALLVQLGGLERTIERDGSDIGEIGVRVTKKVAGALRHTSRLTRLVDSLLDVSRLSAHRLHLSPEDGVDLAELARDACERFNDEARQAGCRFSLNATAGATGRWDRMRMDQMITNLLSNALKYGRGKPIDVDIASDADAVTLTVRDHGIGIPPEDQVRIFEQFERAVSTQNYGGLGLGLFITRQLVEAHGGTITVESNPGDGATFTVYLPRAGATGTTTGPIATPPAGETTNGHGRPREPT